MQEKLIGRGTQAKFARRAGITTGTVSKWAKGEMTSAPNFENCIRIAKYFDLAPTEVFEMAERPDFTKLFLELFPDYQPRTESTENSLCPENNPDHLAFHREMERIMHEYPRGEAITRVALPSLRAIIEAALSPQPEGKQFSPEAPIAPGDRIRFKRPKTHRRRQ